MIDRPSRDRLVTALRQYVSGRLTNDELDSVQVDWRDSGAMAVKEMAWCLYDDTYQHRATGKHHIPRTGRDDIARWMVFLHSDLEYTWPRYSFWQIVNWPMNLLTFGWWERAKARKFQEFMAAADYSVWPFAHRSDFEAALQQPRYLAHHHDGNA